MKRNLIRNCAIATLALSAAFAAAQEIGVQVNNEDVVFPRQQPVYTSGRVLVPLRGVFEKMGATVQWHPTTRTVTAMKGSTDVSLKIGEKAAVVDGQTLVLDVPAQVINGSTMVPIRFLSETLGAQVTWNDATHMVMIYSVNAKGAAGTTETTGAKAMNFGTRKFLLETGTVIPVTLQTRVSSKDSKKGDLVRASIGDFSTAAESWENNRFHFPPGSVLEGRIVTAIPKEGSKAGVIEMSFGRIVLPNGRTTNIDGSLISLTDKSVARNANGVLIARKTDKDNRMVYTGYGAGAGLILGLVSSRPLEKAAIGGLLGFAIGSLSQQQKQANDVNLQPGTQFGVRLDQSATLTLSRKSE
jgi:hypothetical protein